MTLVLTTLVLGGALLQACSDNTGPAGPSFPAGQTGFANTGSEILVQVAVNPNTIKPGQRAGITVLVTNLNGQPIKGKHVQLSTTAGKLDVVDGFTDIDGKFVSFLFVSAADASTVSSATVTAFVEGASGSADVNFGAVPTLVIIPSSVTRTFGAVGAAPGTCAVGAFTVQFTVSGGVPPYTFSVSGTLGGTISGTGAYTAPAGGIITGGTTIDEVVTVRDSVGVTATATITLNCTAVVP